MLQDRVIFLEASNEFEARVCFISGGIKAGFPSPAQDFMDENIDLKKFLIQHPNETFFARVDGNSMINAGISDGDIVVVDRSLPLEDGKIYVCALDGDFTIKRVDIDKKNEKVYLVPENETFERIEVPKEHENFMIWGRVTRVIKQF